LLAINAVPEGEIGWLIEPAKISLIHWLGANLCALAAKTRRQFSCALGTIAGKPTSKQLRIKDFRHV